MTEDKKKYMDQFRIKNKESILLYNKKYNLENRKIKKIWRLKNKERIEHSNRLYRLNNKERMAQLKLNWDKEQRKNNPNFKLKCNLRNRVWSALKGTNKSASTMELIGCSIDKLWNHLESKFESWMTKENYGLWHVDHIIACAKFDLTCPEQQRTCFHYTNLQPMEAIENMRKGAR